MRGLKILVGVMGVLIVLGTVGLVVAIVQKMNEAATGPATPGTAESVARLTTDLALRQPPGTRIVQMAEIGGQLAIWVERADGPCILMVDLSGGQDVREIRVGE
ncbi:hypothetical protein ACFOD4_11680 [Pseudoroseomonas globiformis]|uniref:PepSY domain-containing protein n=1 Tax=Teichococcus globiformis TaxID=2307229 RepID=A0ABV7G1G6_9PROT